MKFDLDSVVGASVRNEEKKVRITMLSVKPKSFNHIEQRVE